ncbi:MAG: DNA-binding domain-containing protein [Rhodobacteraceae bacterium]|nr:DNA-binding domain-containing protein [Paracoccaceae bacterium]
MNVGQKEFTSALLDPDLPVPQGLTDSQGRPAGKRFDVYRNNVVFSLLEAMQTAFPVIRKLVGPNNFNTMCSSFVRKHPPTSPILMFYGAAFPEFLHQYEPVRKYPYMPDVARLELARRVAYHAADVTPIKPEVLAEIPSDQLMESRFSLAPAMQIVQSDHPIVALWEFNMIEGAPKPEPVSHTALITRAEFDPEIVAISKGSSAFLKILQQGETLSGAFERATERDPEFDLSTTLGLMLQTQIITNIHL